jgi:subtilisin family serine protease
MQKFYLRTILLCSWLSFTGILAAQQAASLTPRLQAKMAQSAPNAYIRTLVSMRAQADIEALETKFADMQKLTPEQRSFEVITALQNVARNTQGALSAELDAAKNTGEVKSYEKFWVVNLFMIEARKDFIQSLTQHAEIDYIDLDGELKLEKFKVEKMDGPLSNTSVGGIEPGLCAINVRPLWKLGYTGCGRKVMGIDTGVDGTHPALSARWAGNSVPSAQAWLDQMTSPLTTTPTDCDGHGTHTMGTMIGLDPATSDTVGVAIGATWMAAQTICSSPHTSYSIAAFQWAMDPDGNAGTVNDRPDAINNSWYDPDVTSCDITYQNLFTNVEAAGIAVVFSAGNSGSGASTITNPKNINTSLVNTFCVANVSVPTCTTAPTIASSSSRGPSTCGGTGSLLIKPEVSAPGTDVRSSYVGGGYSFLTGTSMAAPHVAGAIALLKEAFPSLTGTQIKLALYNTCTDLGAAGEDNTYGMGMINVLAAYNYLKTNHLSAWSPPCENVCSGVTYLYGCSGTFTDGSGPGLPYANNANCSWYIVGAGSLNTPITLTFDSLDIEYGYDSIYVYDGPNSSSPLLATITGTTIPAPIVSSTYDMFVRFKSDFTVTRPGFQARYSSAPLKPTITGPSSTCVGTIGVLNGASCGNCNYTYSWTGGFTGPTRVVAATGSYTVTATNSCGSTASNPFAFTINPLPPANAGVDKTICNGGSTVIGSTAQSGVSYMWSPTTGLSNSNIATPTASPTTTTTYIVTAFRTSTGCYKTDTVKVTVLATPTANAGADKTICAGTSTTIGTAAVAGTTYSWTPSTGLSSATAAMPTANPTTTTTYNLVATLTATGCAKSDAVVVTVNALPTANAGVDKTICAGSSTTIGSAAISGTTYLWSPTTALSSATAANPTATPTVTTTYIVTATKTLGGCTKKDTVKVTVNPLPNATAGVDKSVCAGSAVVIGTSSSTAGVTYQWTPPTGLSSTTVTNPMASPTTTTTYTVTALNTATGCAKSDAVVVTVNPLPTANAGLDKTLCAGGSTTIGTTGTSGLYVESDNGIKFSICCHPDRNS